MLCFVRRQPRSHRLHLDPIYPAFGFKTDIILKRKEKNNKQPSSLSKMKFFLSFIGSLGCRLSYED